MAHVCLKRFWMQYKKRNLFERCFLSALIQHKSILFVTRINEHQKQ